MKTERRIIWLQVLCMVLISLAAMSAHAQDKPNILVIWGDDIGFWNISAINRGMMGYKTPNIDRIANGGMWFTDYYGEQSCTAGRAAFITGQLPVRTGLTKVGMPGAKQGIQAEDPTIAELLKPLGYVTGQFGKNHLGDLDEHLPTNHGFDEFFGNLYHLNMEEEPELPDYPKSPEFKKKFGPRGVIKASADGKVEDSGPLTKKRMETVDEEFLAAALDFIERAHQQKKPFFVWHNSSRMHVWTHLKPESRGASGVGLYPDGMMEHDSHVGQLLDKLDELGIADNTIVVYSTDNGAEVMTWPDGGTTPFHGEKATTWEGGMRVPAMVRWPAQFPAGRVVNGIVGHNDWLPTFLAAAGEPNIVEKLKKGHSAGNKTFKVHLDGYNMLDYLKSGGEGRGPRETFYYFTDAGLISAVRVNDFKIMFTEQRATGFGVWKNPFTPLAWPHVFNLRADPFERAHRESTGWENWAASRMFTIQLAQAKVAELVATFKAFPQRQRPGSFSVSDLPLGGPNQ